MKKILFLVIIASALFSCSKSSDEDNTIIGKSYIFKNDTLLVRINTVSITIYIHNEVEYQKGGNFFAGDYPNTTFRIDEFYDKLDLVCTFDDYRTFTAENKESTLYGSFSWSKFKVHPFTLPKSMNFTYSTEILDKNGDGILDSAQNL